MKKYCPGTLQVCLAAIILWFAPTPARAEIPPPIRHLLEAAAARDAKTENKKDYLKTALLLATDAYPGLGAELAAFAASLAGGASTAAVSPSPPPPPAAGIKAEKTHGPRSLLDRLGFSGDIQLGGSLTSGNTDERAVTGMLNLRHQKGAWKNTFGLDLGFTRTMGVTSKQRFVADYKLDYRYSTRAFVFGYLQYEDDRFSGFDFRTSESAGIGYQLVRRQTMHLSLEGGPALRQDRLDTGNMPIIGGRFENEVGGRLNSEFEWLVLGNATLLNRNSFFIGSERATLDTVTSLKMKINSRLSGVLSYDLQWDNNVPEGKKQVDTVTRFTFQFNF